MLVGKIQQYKPPERVTGKGAQHWAKNNTQNEKPEEVFDSDANFNKEGFFFLHAAKQLSDITWVFRNLTQFWRYLPGDRPHRLKFSLTGRSTPTTTSYTITSPSCHLCFWHTSYRWEVSMTPFP